MSIVRVLYSFKKATHDFVRKLHLSKPLFRLSLFRSWCVCFLVFYFNINYATALFSNII